MLFNWIRMLERLETFRQEYLDEEVFCEADAFVAMFCGEDSDYDED